jgi:hypothetical protein
MPVVYLLIGKSLENNAPLLRSPLIIIFLFLCQGISQRLIWITPDHFETLHHTLPILTPIGNNVPYLDLSASWASPLVAGVALLQYIALGFLLLIWLSYKKHKISNKNQMTIAVMDS